MRNGSGGKRDTRPSSAPLTRTSKWRSFDCFLGLRSSDKLTIAVRSSVSSAKYGNGFLSSDKLQPHFHDNTVFAGLGTIGLAAPHDRVGFLTRRFVTVGRSRRRSVT